MGFREKIARFFYGRYITYGFDRLNTLIIVICLALSVINLFIGSILLSLTQSALFIYCFWRLMSKNIYARQQENRKIENMRNRFKSFLNLNKKRFSERRTHIYKTCPHCKATLRLPRRRGHHNVNCPKCKRDFKIRVL